MKSLHLIKKVVAFVFIVFSLSLMFQNSSFAQAYSLQTQDSVYLLSATSTLAPPSRSTTPQLEKIEWQITSVPIRPLLPGKEWEAETIENGNQLLIKHGGKEALTLLSSANSQLEKIEWEITSVPIRPLLPGKEWEAETIENGNKLVIKHGNEEALTLVRKQ